MKADQKQAIALLKELRTFAETPRPTIELTARVDEILATLGEAE